MLIKLMLYIIFTFISAFGLSSLNFEGFVKKNKNLEIRVLVMVLSFSFGYLLTNFVIDFLNI